VTLDPRTPVVVGVGQVTIRPDDGGAATLGLGPVDLPIAMMVEAVRRGARDAGAPALLDRVDSVRVVSSASCKYRDPAALVAAHLGLGQVQTGLTRYGGQVPSTLLGQTATEIAAGERGVVVLTGGESWYTRTLAARAGETLPQTVQPDTVAPDVVLGGELGMWHERELALGIQDPIQVYPLIEQALRVAARRSLAEHRARLAALWSAFSRVAVGNEHAWDRRGYTPDEVATVTPANRMVGFPYPKLLNSNERVDEAAAVIVCSVEQADALGVPDDRRVYPHAIAEGTSPTVSERVDLAQSPAATSAARTLRDATRFDPDDLACVDLYSCFPSAVQLQAASLGVPLDPPPTVTGGMRFAGGPWNNYAMHGIAAVVDRLRHEPGRVGLASANGGYVSKISMGLYSTTPPAVPFRHLTAIPTAAEARSRALDVAPEGPAVVETYTVMHDGHNEPVDGILTLRMPDGRRAWGRIADPATLVAMTTEDAVGRPARVHPDSTADLE
jgi:acetyl-CoA C-acetyltransferase